MMIFLLLAAAVLGVLAAAAVMVAATWPSIPRSNADFEWLEG